MKIPVTKENIKDLTGLYNKLREDMAKSNDSAHEDTGGFIVEGMVLYAHTGGPSWRMMKCKPEQIEKIHWAESGVIQRIELWNTAINAFEDIEPDMDYLIELLKEEYTEKMIYKSRERINRIFRDVTEHMKMVKRINEIWTLAKEKGFDVTKDKAETLGFVSRYFSKKEMKKVGSVILMASQKVHQQAVGD